MWLRIVKQYPERETIDTEVISGHTASPTLPGERELDTRGARGPGGGEEVNIEAAHEREVNSREGGNN
jgi:hypothetical protein